MPIQDLARVIESEEEVYYAIPKCPAIGAREQPVPVMSMPPGEDIGRAVHELVDQVLVFVKGKGRADLGGETHDISPGDMFAVAPSFVLPFCADACRATS